MRCSEGDRSLWYYRGPMSLKHKYKKLYLYVIHDMGMHSPTAIQTLLGTICRFNVDASPT